ncbi:MAG: hypothetical protein EBY22_15970 [Gammaproteobacteria bacterium]|nr:hypothetical protein [Gammaproteobacteria bacterium]
MVSTAFKRKSGGIKMCNSKRPPLFIVAKSENSPRLREQPSLLGRLDQNHYQSAHRLDVHSNKYASVKAIVCNKLYHLAIALREDCFAQRKSTQQMISDFLLGVDDLRGWL